MSNHRNIPDCSSRLFMYFGQTYVECCSSASIEAKQVNLWDSYSVELKTEESKKNGMREIIIEEKTGLKTSRALHPVHFSVCVVSHKPTRCHCCSTCKPTNHQAHEARQRITVLHHPTSAQRIQDTLIMSPASCLHFPHQLLFFSTHKHFSLKSTFCVAAQTKLTP